MQQSYCRDWAIKKWSNFYLDGPTMWSKTRESMGNLAIQLLLHLKISITTFLIISMPSTTLPKTTCAPSSHSVLAVQIKNWEPLVLGPALAIERIPGPVCFNWNDKLLDFLAHRTLTKYFVPQFALSFSSLSAYCSLQNLSVFIYIYYNITYKIVPESSHP